MIAPIADADSTRQSLTKDVLALSRSNFTNQICFMSAACCAVARCAAACCKQAPRRRRRVEVAVDTIEDRRCQPFAVLGALQARFLRRVRTCVASRTPSRRAASWRHWPKGQSLSASRPQPSRRWPAWRWSSSRGPADRTRITRRRTGCSARGRGWRCQAWCSWSLQRGAIALRVRTINSTFGCANECER